MYESNLGVRNKKYDNTSKTKKRKDMGDMDLTVTNTTSEYGGGSESMVLMNVDRGVEKKLDKNK